MCVGQSLRNALHNILKAIEFLVVMKLLHAGKLCSCGATCSRSWLDSWLGAGGEEEGGGSLGGRWLRRQVIAEHFMMANPVHGAAVYIVCEIVPTGFFGPAQRTMEAPHVAGLTRPPPHRRCTEFDSSGVRVLPSHQRIICCGSVYSGMWSHKSSKHCTKVHLQ